MCLVGCPRNLNNGKTASAIGSEEEMRKLNLIPQYSARLVRRLLFASCAFIYLHAASLTWAAGLENAIPDCPRWLAAADDFLDECKAHARYFTRTFYPSGGSRGEKEEHKAWFAAAPSDSHFLMGCTLRFDGSLRFLGLYYTAEPSAIAVANTAPILGIGFDGDAVLSVDGHPVTFFAVRPFDTPKVRTQWSGGRTTAVNCQSALGEDGLYHLMGQNIFADLSHFDHDGRVDIGSLRRTQKSEPYVEFFPSTMPREVIYAWFHPILVTTSGSILVRKDKFPEACHEGIPERIANSPLLLHQLCRIGQKFPPQ
jgi:hypothetical protein